MTRPFAVKGRKKRKHKSDKYYQEEDEEKVVEETAAAAAEDGDESGGGGENNTKKLKRDDDEEAKEATAADVEKAESVANELAGIPISLKEIKKKKQPGVIFILDKACLEVAKVGKTYQILNSEDHVNFLLKNKRNPADYRPDISHQALLMILDSALTKAGKLQALYVRTEKNVLFKVNPHVRLPRTYKRFAGLMLQLLQKLSISAQGKKENLMRVVKNPVTQYLPVNSRKIGFSHSSEKLVSMTDYVGTVTDDTTLVFVVGAMAHGKIEPDYIDDFISISEYPLSAAYCISRITNAVEQKYKIV